MLRYKVLLDSCVIIAASVLVVSEELSLSIKHRFFDESNRLIGIIKRNLIKRIGIITATVENESFSVLEKSIKDELSEKITSRIRMFQTLSIVFNICESRMRGIIANLVREPVDPAEKMKLFREISDMYQNLREYAFEKVSPNQVADLRAKAVPKRFRKLAYGIYREQAVVGEDQLMRLVYNPPDDIDKEILADATYLLSIYKRTEDKDTHMFLASTDHHFSPVRKRSGMKSRIITDNIKNRFGISCEWPDEVASILEKAKE